jgi:hypothetical protein
VNQAESQDQIVCRDIQERGIDTNLGPHVHFLATGVDYIQQPYRQQSSADDPATTAQFI